MAAAEASLLHSQVSKIPQLLRHACHLASLTHATWQVPGRQALVGQRVSMPSSPTAAHGKLTPPSMHAGKGRQAAIASCQPQE